MKYILDTDHLGEFQKGTSSEAHRLRLRMEAATAPVVTTIITVEEVMRGWMASIRRTRDSQRLVLSYSRLQQLFSFFATWTVLPWDEHAASIFDDLRGNKIRIGTMDLRIASIAVAHEATLLTRNDRDFSKVLSLRTEDWLA